MAAVQPQVALVTSAGEYVPTADQRVVVYGVSWAHYERVDHSRSLPGLDLALLCSVLDRPFTDAKREFRAAVRQRP